MLSIKNLGMFILFSFFGITSIANDSQSNHFQRGKKQSEKRTIIKECAEKQGYSFDDGFRKFLSSKQRENFNECLSNAGLEPTHSPRQKATHFRGDPDDSRSE